MLYNKRQVRKANDKKVLHKVGKQWQVVSLALLMAIGGFGIATHASAHADTTNNDNRANVNNTNTLKERLNSSLQKSTPQQNNARVQSQSNNGVNHAAQSSTQFITNQASVLHNRILQNATIASANSNQKQVTAPQAKVGQTRIGRVNPNFNGQKSAVNGNNQADNLHERINQNVQFGGAANQEYTSDAKISVEYVNSDGTLQHDKNGNVRAYSDTVSLSGSDKTTKTGFTFNAPKGYTIADSGVNNDYNWIMNGSNYTFTGLNGQVSDTFGGGTIVNNPNSIDSGNKAVVKNGDTWANWDNSNQRPLIVLKADNSEVKPIKVNFYNQSGIEVNSKTLHGNYGDTINAWSAAMKYNPDPADYKVGIVNPNFDPSKPVNNTNPYVIDNDSANGVINGDNNGAASANEANDAGANGTDPDNYHANDANFQANSEQYASLNGENQLHQRYQFGDQEQDVTVPLVGKSIGTFNTSYDTTKPVSVSNKQVNGQQDSNNKVTVNLAFKDHKGNVTTLNNKGQVVTEYSSNAANGNKANTTQRVSNGDAKKYQKTIYVPGRIGQWARIDPQDFLTQIKNSKYDPRSQKYVGEINPNKPVDNSRYTNVLNSHYNPGGWYITNPNYNPGVQGTVPENNAKQYNTAYGTLKSNGATNYIDNAKWLNGQSDTHVVKKGNYNPYVWVHINPNWNPGDQNTGARYSDRNNGQIDNTQYQIDGTAGADNTYASALASDTPTNNAVPKPNGSDVKGTLKGGANVTTGVDNNRYTENSNYNPQAAGTNPNYMSPSSTLNGVNFVNVSMQPINVTNKAYNPNGVNLGSKFMVNPSVPTKAFSSEPVNNDPTASQHLGQDPSKPVDTQKWNDGTNGTTKQLNPDYNPSIWYKVNSNYNPRVSGNIDNHRYVIDSSKDGNGIYKSANNENKPGDSTGKVLLSQAQWNRNVDSTDDIDAQGQSEQEQAYQSNPNYNPGVTGTVAAHPDQVYRTQNFHGFAYGNEAENGQKGIIDNSQKVLVSDSFANAHKSNMSAWGATETTPNGGTPDNNRYVLNPNYNPGHLVSSTPDNTKYVNNDQANNPNGFQYRDSDLANYVVDPSNVSDAQVYLNGIGNNNNPEGQAQQYNSLQKLENDPTVNFTFDEAPSYSSDVRPITLKYVDSSHNTIASDVITPTASDYGKSIDVTNSDSLHNNDIGASSVLKADGNTVLSGAQGKQSNAIQGMKVPKGYQLANDHNQNTRFVFNSDNQTAEIEVVGNKAATNDNAADQMTVNITEQLMNSDGTENHSDNQNGWSNGQKTVSVNPKISGNIGDHDAIYSAQFEPGTNYVNNMLTSADVNKLTLANGYYSAPGDGNTEYGYTYTASGLKFDGGQSNPLTFNYDVYPQQKQTGKNTIYYVSTSDVNSWSNSDWSQINHDPNKLNALPSQNFETSVSDVGDITNNNGANDPRGHFSDTYYRNNVPEGYQFYGVLSVSNGNKANGIQGFAQGGQSEVIEVIPNAKPITVNYVDQNGNTIKQVTTNATTQNYITPDGKHGYNSRFGSDLPIKKSGAYSDSPGLEDNVSDGQKNILGVPDGYSVQPHKNAILDNSGQPMSDETPKFSREPQNITVEVVGNSVQPSDAQNTVHVTVNEENDKGAVTNKYTDSDHINGRIGDQVQISADDYLPKGYNIDNSNNQDKTVSDSITQQGIESNRNIQFYYKPNTDSNISDLKPISVVYSDNGKQVGFNTIPVQQGWHSGESVNVDGLTGWQVPSGYDLAPGQNTTATVSTTQEPTLKLKVYNPTYSDAGIVAITKKFYENGKDHNGTPNYDLIPSNNTVTSDVVETGKKGTTTTIHADDYNVDGYSEKARNLNDGASDGSGNGWSDKDQTVTFGNNGQVTPEGFTWNYLAESSNDHPNHKPNQPHTPGPIGPKTKEAQPIWLQYYTGHAATKANMISSDGVQGPQGQGSDDMEIDGNMGQNFSDITQANNSTKKLLGTTTYNGDSPSKAGMYHLTGIQNVNYTISNQPQQANIFIAPNSAKDAYDQVKVQYSDGNGHTISSHLMPMFAVSDGQTETLQPSDYNDDPTDYSNESNPYTVKNDDGTLKEYNPNTFQLGGNAADPITFTYKVKNSNSDKNIQPISVVFYNKKGQLLKVNGQNSQTINTAYGKPYYMGEDINLAGGDNHSVPSELDTNDYGLQMPTNYNTLSTDPNQNLDYKISNVPQTVNLIVQGDHDSSAHKLQYHRTEYNSDGSTHSDTVSDLPSVNYGSDFTVNANTNKPVGFNIMPDQSSDTISVGNDGTLTPSSVNYYYDKKPSQNNDGALFVKFVDQNGSDVGNEQIISGKDRRNAKIANVTDHRNGANNYVSIPSNFRLSPGQNLSYQFTRGTGSEQKNVNGNTDIDGNGYGTMTLKLTGNQNHNTVEIHRILIHRNGSQSSDYVTSNKADVNDSYGGDTNPDPQQVSDNYGSSLTLNATENNFVPVGYHASSNDSPATFRVLPNGKLSPADKNGNGVASFIYDQNSTDQAGDITLTYINQNGVEVSPNGNTSGESDKPDDISGYNMFGQNINVNSSDQVTGVDGTTVKGEATPKGYYLDPGQNTEYTFGSNSHNVTLFVHGDTMNPSDDTTNNQLKINLHESDSDGKNSKLASTIHKYIDTQLNGNGKLSVGDTYQIMPSQFTPSGYVAHPNDPLNITVNPDRSISLSSNKEDEGANSNTADFYYRKVNNISAPLTLIYINQVNQKVGSDTMQDEKGHNVNVTDPSDGGMATPSGYRLNPNQRTMYTMGSDASTVYLHVTGQTEHDNVQIERVITRADGTTSDQTFNDQITAPNGQNDVRINPSDYMPAGGTYQEDYNKDHTYYVSVNGSQTNPSHITFYYNTKTSDQDAAPITLRYINQHGQQVGYTDVFKGHHIGESIRMSDDPNDGEKVPDGYAASNPDDLNATFSNSPQVHNVMVKGKSSNGKTFTIHQVVYDANGQPVSGKGRTYTLTISGSVGDSVNLSPYGFAAGNQSEGTADVSDMSDISDGQSHSNVDNFTIPNGAHALNEDDNYQVTINPDGSLSSNSTTFGYQETNRNSPVSTINVHYMVSDPNGQTSISGKHYTQLDQESDRGTKGTNFDMKPYRDDLPEYLSAKNYTFNGAIENSQGNNINPAKSFQFGTNGNGLNFDPNSNTADVYVIVQPSTNNNPLWID